VFVEISQCQSAAEQAASIYFNMKKMTIKVDAELAEKYFKTYRKCFGSERKQDIKTFLEGFLIDRLHEELTFLKEELR